MSTITERLTAALADRYRIERELGAGGMATVYLAEDLKHKRHVAVKVLKPELAAVLGAERFVQEITTTAALQHPHILPLFDSGTADGFLFYVMPFIDGETLRGKLDRETQLGVDEAIRIATDVADALHYAHTHGVIHRDIKPENILLANGRPMVADFGIALAVSAAAGGRMTETGLSLGTPHYMSPEQATAEKEITARSDIYSLGSVLYEMLAGQPPHLGGSAQQIIMKIISHEAADVTEHRKSVPPHVAEAIAISLQKLPADRFESAKAFAEALDGSRASLSARGAGSRTTARAASLGLSRRAAVRTAGLVLAGVVGGALVALAVAPRPPAELTRRVVVALPAGEEPVVLETGSSLVTAARNANVFAYASRGPTGQPQLRVRRWDRAESETIDLPTTVCCVRFSPSGDSIAYLSSPGRLWVKRLAGGAAVMVADSALGNPTDGAAGIDWADDGNLYVTGTTGVLRIGPDGSRIEEVASFASSGVATMQVQEVLPGAQAALVTVFPTGPVFDASAITIGVLDFQNGRVESVTRGWGAGYASSGHLVIGRVTGATAVLPFDARTRRVTGPEVPLPDSTLSGAAITADGALLFEHGATIALSLAWVSRDGAVTPVRHAIPGALLDPRISPDGRQILIRSFLGTESPFWVMSADGSNARVVAGDGEQGFRAVWHPRRNSISFLTGALAPGAPRARILEQPLGELRDAAEIPRPDPRVLGSHEWSPDGTWLILRTDNGEPGNGDILAYRPGIDSVAVAVAATPAEELGAAVSPDGRWVAYSSDATGAREIYVTRFPPERAGQVRVSTGGGISPLWSRNSRELFYFDAALNLVAVSVETSPTFRAGTARRLFSVHPSEMNPFSRVYDVSPDGQRFLMMRATSSASSRLMLVTNFLDELRRIAPK